MKFILDDQNNLAAEIKRLSEVQIKMVQTKQVNQMLERAREPGGTPVSTEETRPGGPHGELRQSSSADLNSMTMGYSKEYAPHVEYGHRKVNGGFVQGQRFLYRNVEAQRPIYTEDLMEEIKNGS